MSGFRGSKNRPITKKVKHRIVNYHGATISLPRGSWRPTTPLVDNAKDGESAHRDITSVLIDVEVGPLSHMNTKMIHVVGLTGNDS